MPDREIITSISKQYWFQILQAFENNYDSINALEQIVKEVKEVYRYFEPAFFSGNFYLTKHFNDTFLLSKESGTLVWDKNFFMNKTSGNLLFQSFTNGDLYMWEDQDFATVIKGLDRLTYRFSSNRDYFQANNSEIDITIYPKGSRYAPQFMDLLKALNVYKVERVYHSSCPELKKSWHDDNKLFFRAEGSGRNIPEKHMQESLYEFLRTYETLRGIKVEPLREFNVNPTQPKPVDIRIQWKEANRVALIEIKWLGAVKSTATTTVRYLTSPSAANPGYVQLKGYYDSALSDLPNTIIKSHLVVIDGRRNNLTDTTTAINCTDGLHFKDEQIEINEPNRYFDSIPAFEKPIKMFAAPICN